MSLRNRILMCRPTHFDVVYSINPWMTSAKPVDAMRSMEQWKNLAECISAHCEVIVTADEPGLPDMCFIANAGFVFGKRFVPSRFRHPQRRGEEPAFRAWFQHEAFEMHDLSETVCFEGAGDALYDSARSVVWMGYGPRTDSAAAAQLSAAIDVEVAPLRLVDSRFYHLDTCFCALSNGYAMYFPAAFDAASLDVIEARVAPQRRIVVSEADAAGLACNVVDLGERLLTNCASAALSERLKQCGLDVQLTPLDEFMKAGGGAKCLSLPLDISP